MGKKVEGVIASSDKKVDGKVLPQQEIEAIKKSEGQPIPEHVKSKLEAELNTDLSSIRVHTGDNAFRLANAVGATAFAVGDHIFFAAGKYEPNSAEGRHLLAHELTHVVQQGGGK